jgi:hypothetical protein
MAFALGLVAATPALAQLVPPGFFDTRVRPGAEAKVEADILSYNAATSVISAECAIPPATSMRRTASASPTG